jgi:hypothetical protein
LGFLIWVKFKGILGVSYGEVLINVSLGFRYEWIRCSIIGIGVNLIIVFLAKYQVLCTDDFRLLSTEVFRRRLDKFCDLKVCLINQYIL